MLRACSFGRSFLGPVNSGPVSLRRALRLARAARRRWPSGRLERSPGGEGAVLRWMVPDVPDASGPLCGLLIQRSE